MSDQERKELVEIDVSEVVDHHELQLLLMKALDFPGWYGCNWNAFWDAITGLVEMPKRLRILGWDRLVERLPNEARLMRECLGDMDREYPESASTVEYA